MYTCRNARSLNAGRQMGVQASAERNAFEELTILRRRWISEASRLCFLGRTTLIILSL
jgi:hypothetical protein